MIRTYSTGEAAVILGSPSERWLIQQLRSGRLPGRKIGRHWRLTDDDIEAALDICSNGGRRSGVNVIKPLTGLTPNSRKKVVGSQNNSFAAWTGTSGPTRR